MITKHQFYNSNFSLIMEAVKFFLSKDVYPEHFEFIKTILIDDTKHKTNNVRIKNGIFCINQFSEFRNKAYKKNMMPIGLIEMLVEDLVNKLFLLDLGILDNNNNRYFLSRGNSVKIAGIQGIIDNLIFGFEYIIEKYSNSVIKIENVAKDDSISIGTGFFIKDNNGVKIITNSHVVSQYKTLNVLNSKNEKLVINRIHQNKEKDIAIIEILEIPNVNLFHFNTHSKIIDEIITIGYPSIPMTKDAYQICHKGEVNSFVEDYMGNKLFLISAKTSAGNSGSPVIDSSGRVIGMVTQELFEKNEFEKKGKLPYYGAIPAIEIIKEIKEFAEQS